MLFLKKPALLALLLFLSLLAPSVYANTCGIMSVVSSSRLLNEELKILRSFKKNRKRDFYVTNSGRVFIEFVTLKNQKEAAKYQKIIDRVNQFANRVGSSDVSRAVQSRYLVSKAQGVQAEEPTVSIWTSLRRLFFYDAESKTDANLATTENVEEALSTLLDGEYSDPVHATIAVVRDSEELMKQQIHNREELSEIPEASFNQRLTKVRSIPLLDVAFEYTAHAKKARFSTSRRFETQHLKVDRLTTENNDISKFFKVYFLKDQEQIALFAQRHRAYLIRQKVPGDALHPPIPIGYAVVTHKKSRSIIEFHMLDTSARKNLSITQLEEDTVKEEVKEALF